MTSSETSRRATVIVESSEGILLVSHSKSKYPKYMLPGGHIRKGEEPREAAIRELYEETGLYSTRMEYLFEVESEHNCHIVFLAQTRGEARKRNEITHIRYYNELTRNKYILAWHVGAVISKYNQEKKGVEDKSLETSSGICAGCEGIYDTLYRKGRLYYCKKCLTQTPEKATYVRKSVPKATEKGLPVKKIVIGMIVVGICVSAYFSYSIYAEFLSQEISIDSLIVEPKSVLSGDMVSVSVYVSKPTLVFGVLINLLNDLVGHSEYIEVSVNGKTFEDLVDIGVNESKAYVYPILEKEPGEYVVSVGGISDTFYVSSVSRFTGYDIMIIPSEPHVAENMEISILLENTGGVECTQFLALCVDDNVLQGEDVSLPPGKTEQLYFSIGGRKVGNCNISFSWETGKTSKIVQIVEPVISTTTGTYDFWIDGVQHSYYIGLVKGPDGVTVNSYGDFIVLINNGNAKNPTYSQLCDFLKKDKTDEYPYKYTIHVLGTYSGSAESYVDLNRIKRIIDGTEQSNPPRICADFAETLHNNAEMYGFTCAYVSIDFSGSDSGHAFCAFNTTDRGIIYIDDTGIRGVGPSNCDKTVDVKVGSFYIPQSLFPEKGWKSTWGDMGIVSSMFLTWDGKWNARAPS